jgi:hypothetical protein
MSDPWFKVILCENSMVTVLISWPPVEVVATLCNVMLSVDKAAPLNDADPDSMVKVELKLDMARTTDFEHRGIWISFKVKVIIVPAANVPALPVTVMVVPDIVHVGVVITEHWQVTVPEVRPKSDVMSMVNL